MLEFVYWYSIIALGLTLTLIVSYIILASISWLVEQKGYQNGYRPPKAQRDR